MANMNRIVRNSALLLFTEECMEEYFDDFNFFHGNNIGFVDHYYSILLSLNDSVKLV